MNKRAYEKENEIERERGRGASLLPAVQLALVPRGREVNRSRSKVLPSELNEAHYGTTYARREAFCFERYESFVTGRQTYGCRANNLLVSPPRVLHRRA